jgi:solute carrier family 25 S-adenosylmethionine transporter 26
VSQFPLYEGLKKAWRAAQGYDTTPMQGAACGSLAGAISSAATTPLDVAKTRMMIGAKSATGELYADLGGWRTLQIIAREEGIKGLFSGIGPRVGWITLGGYVFFGAYEKAQDFLWKSGVWGTKPFGDDHKN